MDLNREICGTTIKEAIVQVAANNISEYWVNLGIANLRKLITHYVTNISWTLTILLLSLEWQFYSINYSKGNYL